MRLICCLLIILPPVVLGETKATWEGRAALLLENDKIGLTILEQGTTMPRLLLKADRSGTNPLWDPIRMARELGRNNNFGGSIGHFLCADGFGPVSEDEKKAGGEGHGEAHRQVFTVLSSAREGKTQKLAMKASLPIHKETVVRTFRLVDGEQVVAIETEFSSELGFDRPLVWGEHATIGSPFLQTERTVVDLSAGACRTRPHEEEGLSNHRLPSGKDFTWPFAPTLSGGVTDMRIAPEPPNSGDHTTCRMDPNLPFAWATALHLDRRLLLGYVWKQADFPWIQNWLNYPSNGKLARGLEFATMPFDVPRRQAITQGRMFGAPTFRWLPAMGKATATFWMFYTEVPEGFRKVDQVSLEGGKLVLSDLVNGKRVELAASQGF